MQSGGREECDEWGVGSCAWSWICDEHGKSKAPAFVCRRPGQLASLDQADSAWDISTGLQAFLFLLAWVRVGVRQVAVAAAGVLVVERVFGIVAAFAVGELVLTFAVSVH